jgi:hypothetical protein
VPILRDYRIGENEFQGLPLFERGFLSIGSPGWQNRKKTG